MSQRNRCYERTKHNKGSKERYLSGGNTRCQFSGWSPLSSHKTTLKQLNSEKWHVELGHLFAFGWATLFSCPMLAVILVLAFKNILLDVLKQSNSDTHLIWDHFHSLFIHYIYQETLVKNNHPFYFLPAPTPHLPKIKVAGSVRAERSSCKMSRHPHFSQDRGVFMQNVPSSTLPSGQRGLHAVSPVITLLHCHPRYLTTCSQLSGFHPRSCQRLFSFGAVTQGWPRVGCVPNQYHY